MATAGHRFIGMLLKSDMGKCLTWPNDATDSNYLGLRSKFKGSRE